jgi:hypothetical protein
MAARDDLLRNARARRLSPFERRTRGGWRFGTRRIADHVVERLIASCRAIVDGDLVRLLREEPAE